MRFLEQEAKIGVSLRVGGGNSQLYSMLYVYMCDMYGKGAENKNL